MNLRMFRNPIATLLCVTGVCIGAPVSGAPANALSSAVRVRIQAATPMVLDTPVDIAATVSPWQRATIAAETAGRVVARDAEPGRRLKQGERLIAIDPARADLALRQARQELRARDVDLKKAEHDLRRGEELFRKAAISQDRLDDLKFGLERQRANVAAAQALVAERERARRDTDIRAPFDGLVTQVMVHVGDYLAPGTPVVHMADFTRVRVLGGVTADEAARIDGQTHGEVVFDTFAGRTLTGDLASVGHVADPRTGTYAVELWVTPPEDMAMRDGLAANVVIAPRAGQPVLTVPPQAIVREGAGSIVYVLEGDVAKRHAVTVGRRTRSAVEIRAGLEPGARVVTEGHFALRDGAPVTVDGG